MTSFDVYERSEEGSRPIEVYSFAIGSSTYRYTSHATDVTVGVDTYTAIPISRGAVFQGAEERRNPLAISMPSSESFAALFVGQVPGQVASVSIFRLQLDESPTFNTQSLIFKGTISAAKVKADLVEFQARTLESAAGRTIPRVTFMGMCNHMLYSSACGANPASFSHIGEVLSTNGNVIEVDGANSEADGYWTGGYCKPNAESEFRLILAHSGNNLTLLMPFNNDLTGSDVQMFAGCDHLLSGDCANKFDRVIDNGSFSFVPNKNPFATGLD